MLLNGRARQRECREHARRLQADSNQCHPEGDDSVKQLVVTPARFRWLRTSTRPRRARFVLATHHRDTHAAAEERVAFLCFGQRGERPSVCLWLVQATSYMYRRYREDRWDRYRDRCVCVIAHANGGSRGPRKDRPVLLTVLHHSVCVFKAPRTYTPVLGALVSPLGTR